MRLDKKYNIQMEDSDLIQEFKRHEVTGEYSKAFLLCLNNLKKSDVGDWALSNAQRLLKEHKYNVFEENNGRYSLPVNIAIDLNWLLDIAIELGYKNVEKVTMSIGWFSSIEAIRLGGCLAKHTYGVQKTEQNGFSILFEKSIFYDDYKMFEAICQKLIKEYLAQEST